MTEQLEESWADVLQVLHESLLTSSSKGKALEDFCAHFFSGVIGLEVADRNVLDDAKSQELDIVLWNSVEFGLVELESIVFVEAKNWSEPVGSAEVAWFDWKLRLSGYRHGFLVAMKGVTGRVDDRSSAWAIVFQANREGRRIILVTPDELMGCGEDGSFRELVRRKLMLIATQRHCI